jgi:hypothetical protein
MEPQHLSLCVFSLVHPLFYKSQRPLFISDLELTEAMTISAAFNLLLLVKTEQDVFKTTRNFPLATCNNAKSISIVLYLI